MSPEDKTTVAVGVTLAHLVKRGLEILAVTVTVLTVAAMLIGLAAAVVAIHLLLMPLRIFLAVAAVVALNSVLTLPLQTFLLYLLTLLRITTIYDEILLNLLYLLEAVVLMLTPFFRLYGLGVILLLPWLTAQTAKQTALWDMVFRLRIVTIPVKMLIPVVSIPVALARIQFWTILAMIIALI
jgi:hypothetical protein